MKSSKSKYSRSSEHDSYESRSYEESDSQSDESFTRTGRTDISTAASRNRDLSDKESTLSDGWKNFREIVENKKNKFERSSPVDYDSEASSENNREPSSPRIPNKNRKSTNDVFVNNKDSDIEKSKHHVVSKQPGKPPEEEQDDLYSEKSDQRTESLNQENSERLDRANKEALWNEKSRNLLEKELRKQSQGSKDVSQNPKRVYVTRNLAFGNYSKNKDLLNRRFNQDSEKKHISERKFNLSDKDFVRQNKRNIGVKKSLHYQSIMGEVPALSEMQSTQESQIRENQNSVENVYHGNEQEDDNFLEQYFQKAVRFEKTPNLSASYDSLKFAEEGNKKTKGNLPYPDSTKTQRFYPDNAPPMNEQPGSYLKAHLSEFEPKMTKKLIDLHQENQRSRICCKNNSYLVHHCGPTEILRDPAICSKCNNYDCQASSHDELCFKSDPTYVPYKLTDYKKIENLKTMGGLGPNIGGDNWQEKNLRLEKLKEFGEKANRENLRFMKKSSRPLIEMKVNVTAHNRRVAVFFVETFVGSPICQKRSSSSQKSPRFSGFKLRAKRASSSDEFNNFGEIERTAQK